MKFKLSAAMLTLADSAAVPAFGADWTVGADVDNVLWEFQDALSIANNSFI